MNLLKKTGFLYFILNMIICGTMILFAVTAWLSSSFSIAYFVFLLPMAGMFTGFWIYKGKYGWWRILVMTVNILLTFAILFTAVFISPKLDDVKQKKLENSQSQG